MSPILFYDGHCPFCHFWVRILLKYDKEEIFFFAPLTGASATSFFKKRGINIPESIVLVLNEKSDEKYYLASTAIFKILKILGGPFRLGLLFQFLPLALTNLIYNAIAKNRFVFGKAYDSCFLPEARHRKRFLD